MLLKEAQSFTGVGRVHEMIVWGRYCLRSKKERERSRHKSG